MQVIELYGIESIFDENVSKLEGGTKDLSKPRPDYFFYILVKGIRYAIIGEYDETPSHEQSVDRLKKIVGDTKATWESTRVQAYHYSDIAVCEKKEIGNSAYYKLTDTGKKTVNAVIVKKILGWIYESKAPNELEGRRQIEMINYNKNPIYKTL